MALKVDRVRLAEASEIAKEVDENKFYNVVVQLGCRTRWRQYSGGRWERDPAKDMNGNIAYKHVAAVHKIGPLDGATVNGLIEKHNMFLRANRERNMPAGDIGRSCLVLGFEETKPPALRRDMLPFDLEELITRVAEASATAAVTAMMKAGGK